MPQLTKVEINKLIATKYCKVESEYGEGTGYILDGKEGVVISSAHLLTAVKRLSIKAYTDDLLMTTVLYKAEYLDDELRITNKAFHESEEILNNTLLDIIEKFRTDDSSQKIRLKIRITPKEIAEMIKKEESAIHSKIELAKTDSQGKILINWEKNEDKKLITALFNAGYVDSSFKITQKCRSSTDIFEIVPLTEKYLIILEGITSADKIRIQQTNFLQKFDNFWSFLERAKHEKEIVLLSDEVLIHCDETILKAKVMLPENAVEKKQVIKNFAYFDALPLKITSFLDNSPFQGKQVILTGESIEAFPEDFDLCVGEEVYFGGYPLTQETYTFSVGMISAIENNPIRRDFVLEGNILPGNSGSPIFIQREGKVYWLGVISSEVARVTERMLQIQESLVVQQEVMKAGGIALIETMREITSTLLGNLSTGKGRAFEVGDISKLFNTTLENNMPFKIDRYLDFLVPKKGKNNIREQITAEINKKNSERIFEVYEYNGKTYYLSEDKHNKHVSDSLVISAEVSNNSRSLKDDKWKKNQPATFNVEFANKYKAILKKVIKTIARSNQNCQYVRFPKLVGWDRNESKQGEETNIIELYYEDSGSHIRPKASSWFSNSNDIIIDYHPVFSETFQQNVMTLFSGKNQISMTKKQEKIVLQANFITEKNESEWTMLKEEFKNSIEIQNTNNRVTYDHDLDKCLLKGEVDSIEKIQDELEEYSICRIS